MRTVQKLAKTPVVRGGGTVYNFSDAYNNTFLTRKINAFSYYKVERRALLPTFPDHKKPYYVNAFCLQHFLSERHGSHHMSNETFIRKGEVGGWKHYFSDKLLAKFDAWTEANLAGTALSFDVNTPYKS